MFFHSGANTWSDISQCGTSTVISEVTSWYEAQTCLPQTPKRKVVEMWGIFSRDSFVLYGAIISSWGAVCYAFVSDTEVA